MIECDICNRQFLERGINIHKSLAHFMQKTLDKRAGICLQCDRFFRNIMLHMHPAHLNNNWHLGKVTWANGLTKQTDERVAKMGGRGDFFVGRKNPDFISKDKKRIIEIFGDFYHKGENPQNKIDYYNKNGYGRLIIWASELKDEQKILEKVREYEKLFFKE